MVTAVDGPEEGGDFGDVNGGGAETGDEGEDGGFVGRAARRRDRSVSERREGERGSLPHVRAKEGLRDGEREGRGEGVVRKQSPMEHSLL